jgi:hypothetical protein
MEAPPASAPGPLAQLAVLAGVGAMVCLVSVLPAGTNAPIAAGLDPPAPLQAERAPRHISMMGTPVYAGTSALAASYSWPVNHSHPVTSPPRPTTSGPSTGPAGHGTPHPPSPPSGTPSALRPCAGLNAAVDAFLAHFYAAHLEESPSQQVGDLLNVDQYVTTHTVLVEHMVEPLLSGADDATTVFLEHLYAAHLEESPSQQAADLLALDQYVKTHTVLVEHMVEPLVGSDLSSC